MENDVKYNRGNGALGRPLPARDHVSALCYPCADANLPAGFSTTDRIKLVYSLEEAEALGIVSTSAVTSIKNTHYQIAECFRMNPKAELYVYLYDDAASTAAVYMTPVISFPENGEIRKCAIFIDDAIDTADLDDIQAEATILQGLHRPFSAVVAFSDWATDYDWSAAPDLRALANPNVTVVIGQDVLGLGGSLSVGTNAVPMLGAALGAMSAAGVHESIAWIGKFNYSNGSELEKVAIGNKTNLVNDESETLLNALTTKGYVFLTKRIGITGTYLNDSSTCDLATSDYAFIENVVTMDKAVRNTRAVLLPSLSSPVYLNADGTLREDSIAHFRALCLKVLDTMEQNGEISAKEVLINPAQPILQTSELVIGIKIVPVGVARKITVNISFALKVAS